MSAAVNDRPHPGFSHVQTPHLPLTGELHPLRREFERWLATGHAITMLVALIVLSALALWDRAHIADPVMISHPGPPDDPHDFSPPPIDRERPGHGMPGLIPVPPDNPTYEPVDVPEKAEPPVDPGDGPGTEDPGSDGRYTPTDTLTIFDPPAPSRSDKFYGGFSDPPVLLTIEPPIYPEMVRDAGIDGTVTVKVLVGRNGRVKDAVVLDGSPALHAAALASVRTAVFRPALQGTEPVEAWVAIPVVFQLQGRW